MAAPPPVKLAPALDPLPEQEEAVRKYLVISSAMVAGVIGLRGGRIHEARLAVGSCSPVAQRLGTLETAMAGCRVAQALECIAPEHLSGLAPISDVRASAACRLEAVAEACRRVVLAATEGENP